jgi:hypothetical protein
VNRRRYRATTETANEQTAKSIEAKERSRILESRHGIWQQPDITFRTFADTYISDYAALHKKSVGRDKEILKALNRAFGSLILHEITAHRIEQFKRERLAGKWRGHKHTSDKPLKPATVNPGTRHVAVGVLQGGRVGQAARASHAVGQTPESGQPADADSDRS